MKCPYIIQNEIHVQFYSQKGNDERNKSTGVSADSWSYQMQDCLEEECAAFKNGECCYNKK